MGYSFAKIPRMIMEEDFTIEEIEDFERREAEYLASIDEQSDGICPQCGKNYDDDDSGCEICDSDSDYEYI